MIRGFPLRRILAVGSSSSRQSNLSTLCDPSIVYSDNHLLAINKPAGWHSVPIAGPHPSSKCLLSELKRRKLGGGSNGEFLLPLHRIDQPCSGLLLLGKTSKAATKVTKLWKKKKVQKEYLCMVSAERIKLLQRSSRKAENTGWFFLKGIVARPSTHNRSVSIVPIERCLDFNPKRVVEIEWRLLSHISTFPHFDAVVVRTRDGSRHMVRALLAQIGNCPIQGDIRYNSTATPLKDKSVALHAWKVSLDPSLKLGSLTKFDFKAPLPALWHEFFGIREAEIWSATNAMP